MSEFNYAYASERQWFSHDQPLLFCRGVLHCNTLNEILRWIVITSTYRWRRIAAQQHSGFHMPNNILVKKVDYLNPTDATALVGLLDMYAQDPMGGSEALDEQVKARLCTDLANHPGAVSWIAYVENEPAGLLNALMGYSTFKARPLMNVHDIAVDPAYRGQGVGQALLDALEKHAVECGCCKLTLEVLSGNHVAQRSYQHFGFEQYALSAETGQALFMQKWL
jgi:GNAT superfamily N-acetyltransferase